LIDLIANQLSLTLGNTRLFQEREETYLEILSSLVAAIDAKDPYSSGHSKRVNYYTKRFCEELNLDEKVSKDIAFSALLHDIGKIGVPENILLKPGNLTPEEWQKIKDHPKNGAEIVNHITQFHTLIDGILCHHEYYDGKGYPNNLKGENIPLAGRIIAFADTFDALTTNRPYRKRFTNSQALSIMEKARGTQFDPHLLDVFLRCFKKGKIKLKKD
jgi:putative nucleotidyltransferase with HDIG domain